MLFLTFFFFAQLSDHQHDHSIERKFYLLPEEEKFHYCERHRTVGNYLFSEAQYESAVHSDILHCRRILDKKAV